MDQIITIVNAIMSNVDRDQLLNKTFITKPYYILIYWFNHTMNVKDIGIKNIIQFEGTRSK